MKLYWPRDSPLRNWVSRLAAGEGKDKAGFRAPSPWQGQSTQMDTGVGEDWEIRDKYWKIHQNRTLADSQHCPRKKIAAGA